MLSLSAGPRGRQVLVDILMTLVGVAASSAALYFVMKRLDPTAARAKLAKAREVGTIAKILGRPMIQTNQSTRVGTGRAHGGDAHLGHQPWMS